MHFGGEHRLERMIYVIARVTPDRHLPRIVVGVRMERGCVTACHRGLGSKEPLRDGNLIRIISVHEVDPTIGYPRNFQLAVPPQCRFRGQVPLPAVGLIGTWVKPLTWRTSSAYIKGTNGRVTAARVWRADPSSASVHGPDRTCGHGSVQGPFPCRSYTEGWNPSPHADRKQAVTRGKLSNTATKYESLSAEHIPGKPNSGSDHVVIKVYERPV